MENKIPISITLSKFVFDLLESQAEKSKTNNVGKRSLIVETALIQYFKKKKLLLNKED